MNKIAMSVLNKRHYELEDCLEGVVSIVNEYNVHRIEWAGILNGYTI